MISSSKIFCLCCTSANVFCPLFVDPFLVYRSTPVFSVKAFIWMFSVEEDGPTTAVPVLFWLNSLRFSEKKWFVVKTFGSSSKLPTPGFSAFLRRSRLLFSYWLLTWCYLCVYYSSDSVSWIVLSLCILISPLPVRIRLPPVWTKESLLFGSTLLNLFEF